MSAKPTLIALITATHHRDVCTTADLMASLDHDELVDVLTLAVDWLTNEIDSACNCCVGFSVDEYLQALGTVVAREDGT